VLDGCISSKRCVTKGVPQSSILRSLLFLIYIDDLPSNIESTVKLFADDLILINHHPDLLICTQILNNDLVEIQKWSEK